MLTPPTVLLVDDHAMFRSGLGMLLRLGMPQLQLLEAATLEEALVVAQVPDLVLLDIKLQGLNGLECMPVFQRKWPRAALVMVSSLDDAASVQLALERGAAAFVSKAESADRIVAVIQGVLNQAAALPEPGRARLAPPAVPELLGARPTLTPRQAEVLNLLCQGLPSKTIGRRLDLSENTVRWHVQTVLGLLNVTSRTEAAFVARRHGLID
jgi:DNA-binding NarL/FixJ family response regulator